MSSQEFESDANRPQRSFSQIRPPSVVTVKMAHIRIIERHSVAFLNKKLS